MLKTPNFWFKKNTGTLLRPLSFLYTGLHVMNRWLSKPAKTPVPVICIGNAGLGGGGKTPTALGLGKILNTMGLSAAYLTRGYGGSLKGPLAVQPSHHKAKDVGDEPLLLASHGLTLVSKNRKKALQLINPEKIDVILMDDGYQSHTIEKHTHILVVDGKKGFGNGLVFPAGPLREPLCMSLKRAQAILIIGPASDDVKQALKGASCPIWTATPKLDIPKDFPKKVYAFAGLAFPEKFFDSLKNRGIEVLEQKSFPDHHPFGDLEMQHLKQDARKKKLPLVTTEKDYMRLSLFQKKYVTPVPMTLQWSDQNAIEAFLKTRLSQ